MKKNINKGKTNKKHFGEYDVDMDGIDESSLKINLDILDNLLKKYGKPILLNKLEETCYYNNNIQDDIVTHVIHYIENQDKNIFTLRRKPDNKSKLWNCFTLYGEDFMIIVGALSC